jgi:tetratricopeptide (TPR) repeat protein
VYLDDNQPSQAEARFAQALATQPGTVAALYGSGQAAMAQKDYSHAVERFEQVLAADPRASIAHYPLALAYRALGDTAKAEAHLSQQGKTEVGPPDPRMVELRNLLASSAAEEARGMRAAEGGDFKSAVEHFRKGVELAPDSVSLRFNLARALSLTEMSLARWRFRMRPSVVRGITAAGRARRAARPKWDASKKR